MSEPLSTDADVQSPAFNDKDDVEGAYDATSIRAVMINRPRQALYDYWRDFRNLPSFMENVKSVDVLDDARSSWTVAGPAGAEIELVSEITEWGLPKRPWLCDSAYGDNTAFRHAMAQSHEEYVAGVSLTVTMWPVGTTFSVPKRRAGRAGTPSKLVAHDGRRPQSVTVLAAALPAEAWQQVLWRHGSRGPQQGRFAAVRVRPARGLVINNHSGTIRPADLQPEQWLLIHWPHGEPKPTKAWLSNLPETTPIERLVALARLRWRIERDHEESKGLVGFDHYEGRTWPGLHHHLALVLVAEQFLAHERLREMREASSSSTASADFPPCAIRERAPANHAGGDPSDSAASTAA
ncbi:MAG: hypothetical protein EON57_10455 [Alphaproteobacteria bacterium]|nr:MAG: hypothetical protein EON57_10455 [Alphaproteobacteria bacterium]